MDIQLKCECGSIQGKIINVSRTLNRRFVCMCNDCQAYAHYLGRVEQMLDRNGGTEVVPVHPARIRFTKGIENLTCVRLSDDGILRWYARCCKTPIANSPSHRLPFAGVIHCIMDFSGDEKKREEALGPVFARVNGKYGIPPLPPGTARDATPGVILNMLRFLGVGVVKRLRLPSPFFEAKTGKPVVKPLILSDAEYYKLIDKVGLPGAKPS